MSNKMYLCDLVIRYDNLWERALRTWFILSVNPRRG